MSISDTSLLDFNKIQIHFKDFLEIDINKLKIKNGDTIIEIENSVINTNSIIIQLKTEIDVKKESTLIHEDISFKILYKDLYISPSFNNRYYYDGNLGNFYTPEVTTFKVWSPAAETIYLLLYENGVPSPGESPKRIKMEESMGLWTVEVFDDLEGLFYTYEVLVYNKLNETIDPYAKACGANGIRGAIVNPNLTSPFNWNNDNSPNLESFTDAIIYETSIRDLSMHPDSAIKNKGKFIGLTEKTGKLDRNITTVFDHIVELGVSHIQLMPIFDFSCESVNELYPELNYNWGYDPQNYNIPEGSYSTDPSNPYCRIRELKQMIQHIHNSKLSVIMDVVYNHVYKFQESCLEKIFPGYYFRICSDGNMCNGSGCGNDTASEHKMMQKFILDSLVYWTEEYHIDGFRFDLMGLHDINTMNIIRETLNKYNRSIILYGEGWELNTALPSEIKATQQNASQIPQIGFFNDLIRNSVRGSVFNLTEQGFVSGKPGLENEIKKSIVGCIDYNPDLKGPYVCPVQSINYVSAHDNNTLWDKLQICCPDKNLEDKKSMLKLSSAIVLTCQGIPFLHSGIEFCRTKQGVENSYNFPDNINWLDWQRKADFMDVFEYHRGLIKLRKNHPAFRMNSVSQIKSHIEFLDDVQNNTVGFLLKNHANNDNWKNIIVIYNANMSKIKIKIPTGIWNLVANKSTAGLDIIENINSQYIEIEGISMYMLYEI